MPEKVSVLIYDRLPGGQGGARLTKNKNLLDPLINQMGIEARFVERPRPFPGSISAEDLLISEDPGDFSCVVVNDDAVERNGVIAAAEMYFENRGQKPRIVCISNIGSGPHGNVLYFAAKGTRGYLNQEDADRLVSLLHGMSELDMHH